MEFRSLITRIGAPVSTAEALTGRTSKWIAKKFGVSRRTAQRWLKGTQQPKPDRHTAVLKSVDAKQRRKIAATEIRKARAVHVGRVQVVDKSPRKGTKPGRNFRNVGTVQIDGPSRDLMNEAADALEAGDTERAEQLMSEGVLRTPGKDYGSALAVDDWPSGFHLI